MKSRKLYYSDREINYDNIPTQQNEQRNENNRTSIYKENKINSRNTNNIYYSLNYLPSGIKYFERNTLNIQNKIPKNNNIKIIPKSNKSNNNNKFKHNKSKSINFNSNIIQGNFNISNSTKQKQAVTKNINAKNKAIRKKQSSNEKNNNKIIKNGNDSAKRKPKYSIHKNKNEDIPKTPETNRNKSTKEITSLNSSNKKTKDYFSPKTSRNINNVSFISGLSCTKSMTEIENNIYKLYEWEKRRKKKIENLRNLKEKKIGKYTYIPKINKRSNSLAAKKKLKNEQNENIFERLSKVDPLIKEKKQILIDLFTPTFQPKICLSERKIHRSRKQSSIEKRENSGKYVIKVNRVNSRFRKEKIDIKIEKKIREDDIIQNMLRKAIIKNINNKFK